MTERSGSHYISTMALGELILRMDPLPPQEVVEAARRLTYRAFILVGLIVNRDHLFPDQWIYVHSPKAKVGRIQNFKNWSADMVPDPAKTSLGMEYFCSEGDEIWSMSDAELLEQAMRDLSSMGWGNLDLAEEGVVFRQAKAYPVYDERVFPAGRCHSPLLVHDLKSPICRPKRNTPLQQSGSFHVYGHARREEPAGRRS